MNCVREYQIPHITTFVKLKRLAGCMASEITAYSDSDWAGDKETRKPSCAGVRLAGNRILKARNRNQNKHRQMLWFLLYATALAAWDTKSIASMMCDLRIVMKLVIVIDAKATEHILHRQGVRHMKHIDVAQLWLQDDVARLWLQDAVRSNRLILPRVDSEHNVA